MISKDTFCRALALIQEQDQINDQVEKALQLVGDGHYVFGTDNRYYKALLLMLKEELNDKYEYIEWWLYDAGDYVVENADGSQKWDLTEPGALYDYLVETAE